jgi:hypothetical protein
MSNDIRVTFLEKPPAPPVGERISTSNIGSVDVRLAWKDGEVDGIEALTPNVAKLHLEQIESPGPVGSIIKTCWECYEDTDSGAWFCLKRNCPPITLPE